MDPHQAPTSPGVSRRPRHGSRTFSMHSNKSGNTPTTPSAQERYEKERRDSFLRGESKANPNAAILEADPQRRNVVEKVTLDPIRAVQAKDAHGNIISEPDLSNPTRPRWERPLDTIRSFEKAIDGDYSRRSSHRPRKPIIAASRVFVVANKKDAEHDHQNGRRASYYGHPGQNRQQGGGYYNSRPESFYDSYASNPAPPRHRFNRGISDGAIGRGHGGAHHYPQHTNGSYENSTGSEGTGPWANSTDPSSQNSSYERLHGMNKQSQNQDNVGERAGGQYAIAEDTDSYGFPPRPPPKNGYASQQPPHPPAHDQPRKPIQLGGSSDSSSQNTYGTQQGGSLPSSARPQPEKRQSWFGRRFSKAK